MSKNGRALNDLERAVLDKLLAGDHPILQALRVQLASCAVTGREFTGHGFFTNLETDRSVAPAPVQRIQVRDVGADIAGLKYGAGFVLFVADGYLDFLEGFSYEEPWPPGVSGFSLRYERERARDPGAISMSG